MALIVGYDRHLASSARVSVMAVPAVADEPADRMHRQWIWARANTVQRHSGDFARGDAGLG